MSSNLALKLFITFLVMAGAFFMWSQQSGEGAGVGEKAGSLLPVAVGDVLSDTGMAEKGYCPFINPYATQLFSAGSLSVSRDHQLYGPLSGIIEGGCGGSPDCRVLDETPGGCGAEYVHARQVESGDYVLSCGSTGTMSLSAGLLAERLNERVEGFNIKADGGIPNWQCLAFFGLLPFVAMFFFLRDILNFTLLSRRVKDLIIAFASMLAIFTGAFSRFVWQLAYMASMSVQSTFLVLMLFLSFISVAMSWIGSFNLALGQAREQAGQLAAGLRQKYTQDAIAGALRRRDNP